MDRGPTARRGAEVRREVLGAYADAPPAPFTEPFREWILDAVWGKVWDRPGLDRRTRSCVTLGVLAALRCEAELAMHVEAAIRNGVTPAEISEVLLHTTVYAGAPAGNAAFAVASQVLTALGLPSGPDFPPEADLAPDPDVTPGPDLPLGDG